MKLGIISDSHAAALDELPAAVRKALGEVDLIVHAGDFTHKAVLDGLRTLGRVEAVCGNMDRSELRAVLPEKAVFAAGGMKFGLVHGFGAPRGIAEGVLGLFADVNVIIFGHSHEPCNRYVDGVLLFNPGPARDSFGIMTIADRVTARVLDSR